MRFRKIFKNALNRTSSKSCVTRHAYGVERVVSNDARVAKHGLSLLNSLLPLQATSYHRLSDVGSGSRLNPAD